MRYVEGVRGTQYGKPADVEQIGSVVYARAGIERKQEEQEGETVSFWEYDEAVLSREEYESMRALATGWVRTWNAALRTAERRARYERMDPKVSSLRRLIDLGVDVEENTAKLNLIHEYCKAVTDTQWQEGYPARVTYPDEPEI